MTEYESVYHPRLWYRRTLWKQQQQQRADPRKTFNKEAARKTCFWPPSRAQKDIHLTLDVCIRVIFQKNLYRKRDGKTNYLHIENRIPLFLWFVTDTDQLVGEVQLAINI